MDDLSQQLEKSTVAVALANARRMRSTNELVSATEKWISSNASAPDHDGENQSADNLLFYMGSNYSVDFMALEMHHGKVTFLWDPGSGVAELEIPDVQINKQQSGITSRLESNSSS
ncbi:hypothetical protein AAFF_G00120350 [Aldrovandia affinis]|uniref:Laminin G domain-containing protein n=1 Tax=Aldrovandia affinis TaxID=143900 RepID=A0AAD7VXE2_9TELE|nr:hypothetical protein AAFF_G00120350 [Aldrovandia affinis]